ncbi:fungal-specific transcription factor domain-containing protein [Aspergillus spinulosporus]
MPKSVSRRSGLPELRANAGLETKKQGTSPCAYCAKTNKPCVFGPRPSRTPLTRRNLDAAETRCTSLLSLLRKLNPEVDIENALRTVAPESEYHQYPQSVEPLEPEPDPGSPGSSRDFEWNEASTSHPPDGMVSLPTASAESGYLGNSSGTRLLQTISDLFPENATLDQQQGDSPARVSQTGSPSLLLHFANTAVLDNLVDAYFLWYNRSYPILHESTFREKYRNRQQIPSRSSWHLIFYLVLAIGHWVSTGGSELSQDSYYMAARSRMSMRMLESGSLVAFQAFLLMGNYLQKRDRPNTGYNYIGIAYRMALGLGLHREPPSGQTNDTLFNERRRVVWWVVYCFDSGFSLTTGRPVMASDSFIETRLPRNIDDSISALDSPLPAPVDRPTTYSAIIAHSRLVSIGNRIFSEIISCPYRHSFSLKAPRAIDHQLKAWRLSLPSFFTGQDIPPWFRGPRAIVGWKEQNLRMLLWWGSQRLCNDNVSMSAEREEARNMCHLAAVETIQDITTFCLDYADAMHVGLSWYATYFLFQASVVLSIHHLKPVPQLDCGLAAVNRELWLSSVERARGCFASLGATNKAALRCLAVLDRIRDRFPRELSQEELEGQSQRPRAHTGGTACQGDPLETGIADASVAPLAVDPTLQMFFEDTSWENDLFEGLNGFPGIDEVDLSDTVPGSSGPTMPSYMDSSAI